MAAVISDFVSDPSHFQHNDTMINGSNKKLSAAETQYLKITSIREVPQSPRPQPVSLPIESQLPNTGQDGSTENSPNTDDHDTALEKNDPVSSPSSFQTSYARQKYMSQENITLSSQSVRSRRNLSRDSKKRNLSYFSLSSSNLNTSQSSVSLGDTETNSGSKVKVKNLGHIHNFVSHDSALTKKQAGQLLRGNNTTLTYEISGMPITDVIELVAGLLTKIVTTHDLQKTTENHLSEISYDSGYTADYLSSVSAFHAKKIPNISILSYLFRIQKYCPTTYEVFLSLIIYFDRMTERLSKPSVRCANKNPLDSNDAVCSLDLENEVQDNETFKTPLASSKDVSKRAMSFNISQIETIEFAKNNSSKPSTSELFFVDSYNIHRLVIAGVTCASKFFSDVFYTNSRYAKVGGLSLPELNHLELQFLLLNDFCLFVPVEEFEAYATMLVEFYAREC